MNLFAKEGGGASLPDPDEVSDGSVNVPFLSPYIYAHAHVGCTCQDAPQTTLETGLAVVPAHQQRPAPTTRVFTLHTYR